MPPDAPAANKIATLYRMVKGNQICPHGLKAKDLLERQGYTVEDKHLTSRDETDAFKAAHGVDTTPQVWVGDKRIGGYDALQKHFGQTVKPEDATSYQPVIAIFGVSALMALAVSWATLGTIDMIRSIEWFIAIAMCFLGVQKLQNIEAFSMMFLNYDLLARRWVRYGYVYPFAEAGAGVLMLAGALTWLAAPVALFIGGIGAISVFKAVYIDRRDLKCACVGGGSNVPLGFISLTENVMMVAMALWMLL